MKINHLDTTDPRSWIFKYLTQLDEKADDLERKAKRLRDFNRTLVYNIHNEYIKDIDDVQCAIGWFEHSDFEPYEIMEIVRGIKTPEQIERKREKYED